MTNTFAIQAFPMSSSLTPEEAITPVTDGLVAWFKQAITKAGNVREIPRHVFAINKN